MVPPFVMATDIKDPSRDEDPKVVLVIDIWIDPLGFPWGMFE